MRGPPVQHLQMPDGVGDGVITLRVGGLEPYSFTVADGVADVEDNLAGSVLAAFAGALLLDQPEGADGGDLTTTNAAPGGPAL
jgi:uncharacterized protein YcfJ